MDEEAGSLVTRLSADLTDLKKGLIDGKQSLDSFKVQSAATAEEVKMSFAGVGAGITSMITGIMGAVAVLGGGKLFSSTIQEYVNLNASAKQLSVEMGLNVGDAQALQMTFNRVGVDTETANGALIMMTRQLKNNEVGFNDLGVKTRDASGNLLPLQQILFNSIDTLKKYKEGTDRTEASMVIFGRQAANMPGFLRMTQEAVDETKNHLAQLGLTLDDTSVAKARAFSEGMHDVGLVVTALQYKIGAEAIPLFMELGTLFSDMGPSMVSGLRSGLNSAIDLLTDITVRVAMFRDFFPMFWDAIGAGAAATKQVLMETCGSDVVGAFTAGMAAMKQAGLDWRDQMIRDANDVRFAIWNARPADATGGVDIFAILQNKAKPPAARTGTKTMPPKAPGGSGGGGKTDEQVLLDEHLKTLEAIRKADLAAGEDQIKIQKATLAAKRAALALDLQEGTIDGQTYYAKLQEMEQQETTAALALIEQKRQAQTQAYQDELANLAQQQATGELKPGVYEERQTAAAFKNWQQQTALDAEAARLKYEGEKKVTDELTRQASVRQEYQDKTNQLNLDTAQLLGQISDSEATLQKLFLDWQNAKREALKAGASPEYLASLQANYQAKSFDASYLGQKLKSTSDMFNSAFSDLATCLMKGGTTFAAAVEQFGQTLAQDTFKMFFKDLSDGITQGLKNMVSSIASGMQSGGGGFSGLGGFFANLFGGNQLTIGQASESYLNPFASAHGNVFSRGYAMAFAAGGIVDRPTTFPMATGQGLMGEAGPEGILPLERINGDLGVKALFPPAGPVAVTLINNTGTPAQASASQKDDGSLEILLEKINTEMVVRGGPFQQILNAFYGPKKGL